MRDETTDSPVAVTEPPSTSTRTSAATRRRATPLVGRAATSAGVGIVATAVDWVILVAAVRLAGVPERWAIVPAFLAAVVVQFVGNQRLAFRAPATSAAAARRQVARFAIVEAGTLVLSAVVYNLLREAAGLDYRPARVVAGLVVYLGFSLPLWHWVFAPDPEREGEPAQSTPRSRAAGTDTTSI